MNDSEVKLLRMLFFRKDGSLNLLGKIALILGILLAGAVASMLSGCLSVVRIPLCDERVSNEGEVTNRVWHSFCDDVPGMRVYPTVKMRCRVTAEWLKPIPPEAKGKRLREMRMFKHWGWIPLGVIWLTAPFDAAIDTAFLPWDLYCRKEAK